MSPSASLWTPLTSDGRVLRGEYAVGAAGGPATTTAYALPEGGWAVLSPPGGPRAPALWDALDGEVQALIAPNPFHTVGLRPGLIRHPNAEVFAPPRAAKRVGRKAGREVAPLERLAPRLPEGVEVFEAPHIGGADTLATVQTDAGPIWLITDLVTNLPTLGRPPLSWLLEGLGFDTGPAANTFGGRWVTKVRRPDFADWLTARWSEAPPSMWVPGHGPVVDDRAALDAVTTIVREAWG